MYRGLPEDLAFSVIPDSMKECSESMELLIPEMNPFLISALTTSFCSKKCSNLSANI